MKTFLLLLSITFTSLMGDELSWVDEQVDAIKPNRNGISSSQISKLKNPFIYLKKNMPEKKDLASQTRTGTKKSKTTHPKIVTSIRGRHHRLQLKAIINSAALVNGKWYKKGDFLAGYRIVKISKTSVRLSKNNKITILTTKSKSNSNKLKFK